MSSTKTVAIAGLLGLALTVPVAGRAPLNIKLATQAPVGSSWHKALLDMTSDWDTKTSGRVKATVYAGGTIGDEPTTIRMMRVDQLQATLLTETGLAQIDDAFNVFGMPFFFQNDAETNDVRDKLSPALEQRLQAKGFKLLAWGSGGWVQLFSKRQLKTLDDIKKAKLFTSQGDDRMVQWYKANGFNPVAIPANDIPAQLKLTTGMIDTAPSPPYVALVLQIFRDAKYMLDVHVAPLLGALVITNAAWSKMDPADQKIVLDAAHAFQVRNLTEAPKQDDDSVATMKTRGLVVTPLDPKVAADLRDAGTKMVTTMRASVDASVAGIYDQAIKERDAFRAGHGGK